jgi:hypothetical protein
MKKNLGYINFILYCNFVNKFRFIQFKNLNKKFDFFYYILFLLNKSKIKIFKFFKYRKSLYLLNNLQKLILISEKSYKLKYLIQNIIWNKKIKKLILKWELLNFTTLNIKYYFDYLLYLLNINLKKNFFFISNKDIAFFILKVYKFSNFKNGINNLDMINFLNEIFLKILYQYRSKLKYNIIKSKFYFILLLYNLFQFKSLDYFYLVNFKINDFCLKNKYIQIKNLNLQFFKFLIVCSN